MATIKKSQVREAINEYQAKAIKEVNERFFEGTLSEFEKAVQDRHQGSKIAKEYEALIQFLRIRFGEVTE